MQPAIEVATKAIFSVITTEFLAKKMKQITKKQNSSKTTPTLDRGIQSITLDQALAQKRAPPKTHKKCTVLIVFVDKYVFFCKNQCLEKFVFFLKELGETDNLFIIYGY